MDRRNIQLKMKYFADYCRHQRDVVLSAGHTQACERFWHIVMRHSYCSKDSPLYLFETKVDELLA